MDIVGPTWPDSRCVSIFLSLDAYESAKMLCDQYYLTSPEVEIKQVNCEREFSLSNFQSLCVLCMVSQKLSENLNFAVELSTILFTLIYSFIDSMLVYSYLTVWDGANKICWVGIMGMFLNCIFV